MNYVIITAAIAVASFTAYSFVKAGVFKLKSSAESLIQIGWGWVKSAPKGTHKFIGLAEVLGGLGVILAPVAVTIFNFDWAIGLGIAAGAGLSLIMVLANLVHIARKEIKYTWKTGLLLLVASLLVTVLLSFYPTA
jgi:hypothetical protein